MRLGRLLLLLLAAAAWVGSVFLLFQLCWNWRSEYDARLNPHDGQIILDVAAFALLVCAGYVVTTTAIIVAFYRRRARGRGAG